MCKKNLRDCHKGKEFVDYAKVHGANIEWGKGDHAKVITDRGICIVPVGHELGKGLWHVVVKTFIAIGISVFILVMLGAGLGLI